MLLRDGLSGQSQSTSSAVLPSCLSLAWGWRGEIIRGRCIGIWT